MGLEVKQETPGWPLQPAMSRGKNSDLGARRVGDTVIYSSINYLFIQHLLPT